MLDTCGDVGSPSTRNKSNTVRNQDFIISAPQPHPEVLLVEGSEAEQSQEGRKCLGLCPGAELGPHRAMAGPGGEHRGRKSYGKVGQQLSPGMNPGAASSWDGPGGSCID